MMMLVRRRRRLKPPNERQSMSSITTNVEQVPASDLVVGDFIGTNRANSRKVLLDAGTRIASITTDKDSGTRVQARDENGSVIRSMSKNTQVWRRTESAAEAAPTEQATPTKTAGKNKEAKKVSVTTETKEPAFTWPKPANAVLLDYLTANVSDAAEAPNQGLPFITEDGTLRIRSEHWRDWLVEQGIAPSKMEATKPIRDLDYKMKPYALPGEGRSHGFYTGPAPEGTGDLPRRKGGRGTRTARPFGTLSDAQRQVLTEALTSAKFRGPLSDARDELLAQL
jgi:hypothetical protein